MDGCAPTNVSVLHLSCLGERVSSAAKPVHGRETDTTQDVSDDFRPVLVRAARVDRALSVRPRVSIDLPEEVYGGDPSDPVRSGMFICQRED